MYQSSMDDAAKAGGFSGIQSIQQKSLDWDIPYKFRLLTPVLPVQKIMYPCLAPDKKDDGRIKQSWRSVRLPLTYADFGWVKSPTIADVLVDIDLAIRKEHRPVGTQESVKSFFNVQKTWVFPAFDRRDSEAVIRYFEVGWTIFNEVRNLQLAIDEDNQGKLANGPIWVHDVVVRKKRKNENSPNKSGFNTAYSVTMAKNNRWAGKFDRDILTDVTKWTELYDYSASDELQIFTEVEKGVYDMFSAEAEMFPLFAPMTPDEIREMFTNFPLCLDAIDNTNNAIFSHRAQYAEALEKAGIPFGYLSGSNSEQMFKTPEKASENAKAEPKSVPQVQTAPRESTAVGQPKTASGVPASLAGLASAKSLVVEEEDPLPEPINDPPVAKVQETAPTVKRNRPAFLDDLKTGK
jgi:hypothetical protein